jgi:DNA recombination protein RmuC
MLEVVLIVVVLVQAVVLLFLFKRGSGDSQVDDYIKQDMDSLREGMDKLREGLSDKLTDRLDKNQEMMLSSLQKQFAQSTKLVGDVSRDLTELKETNKQVVSVTDELKTLQNILQNPKQRGVLGEYYLQSVLENVMPPDRFKMQYAFKDGQIVDAAILLEEGMILPVDSKFSLENYNRLIEEKTKDGRDRLVKLFKADLKLRIDETAKYIRPDEGTLDHAFMFIPSEAIYYDLLVNKVGSTEVGARDLIEYAFREKHVVIVSPTTFLAYLQTVMQGLRSLQIEHKAKEIQKNVSKLAKHVSTYDDFMGRLGKSMSVTVNHYNNAYKELGKIDKDVTKISGSATGVDPVEVDRPLLDD